MQEGVKENSDILSDSEVGETYSDLGDEEDDHDAGTEECVTATR